MFPSVAETWDGYLNDINGSHVAVDHTIDAIDDAAGGAIEEGSVGGGTGMNCYAFNGGSGSASRIVDYGNRSYTVGVFLQANFGSRQELSIAGLPLGAELATDNPMEAYFSGGPTGAGSCTGIVATDAPLLPGQCKAPARRVALGLARTDTAGSHFSGDIFLAFSTANRDVLNGRFPKGAAGEDSYSRMGPHGRFLYGGRAGDRGSRAQCNDRQHRDGRPRRQSNACPVACQGCGGAQIARHHCRLTAAGAAFSPAVAMRKAPAENAGAFRKWAYLRAGAAAR
ncbi:P1 family peptidase [Mesorhizobium hawassense]|uniref:P1 family peptidase n=1 Tax=Mesorhizobium hawassense TaxID=1209954 RepID=UPI001ABFDF55|nr:P1 family peptidase [Mesorhizobium hawassense]